MIDVDPKKLYAKLGFNRIKMDEPLAPYTWMKVGGPAEFLYEAKSKDDLIDAVKIARELSMPFTILGLGANVLVSDKGIKGLVIINKANKIRLLANGYFEVESGVTTTQLMKESADLGYTGMERMIRVPGTVGGAIFMNAGHTREQQFFGDLVASVEVLNSDNEVKKLLQKDCEFTYRTSRFQRSGEIILSAMLHLEKATKAEIEETIKHILTFKTKQPAGPSVGSTFRNPPGNYAGKLIDESGLMGTVIGGAKISENHANFIINNGTAKADDVKGLIELARSTVKEKFGVTLEEEVRYLGDWD